MMLTTEQQVKVEENMGLVGKVIADRVHGTNQYGIFRYEDLFQIGCIGLCKAAATDKGGCFSTYAYRLIWNEICDALIYANRRKDTEVLVEYEALCQTEDANNHYPDELGVAKTLFTVREDAVPTVRKGIDALILMSQGYSCREIGEKMGGTPKLVTAWVSKARKHLKSLPEFQRLYMSGGRV